MEGVLLSAACLWARRRRTQRLLAEQPQLDHHTGLQGGAPGASDRPLARAASRRSRRGAPAPELHELLWCALTLALADRQRRLAACLQHLVGGLGRALRCAASCARMCARTRTQLAVACCWPARRHRFICTRPQRTAVPPCMQGAHNQVGVRACVSSAQAAGRAEEGCQQARQQHRPEPALAQPHTTPGPSFRSSVRSRSRRSSSSSRSSHGSSSSSRPRRHLRFQHGYRRGGRGAARGSWGGRASRARPAAAGLPSC